MPLPPTTPEHRGRAGGPARAALLLAALGTTAALTTACSGPGGVDLGTDWKGSSTFALAKVDGLVTIVGINPDKARAESLVVVPQQADDDDSVSPHIVRLADGRWLLTVPRKDGKPDRRYQVDRKDHTLDGVTGDERLRRILPGKSLVAEVAGLPDAKSSSGAAASSVLVRKPADWTTTRELKVPGTVTLAASDPASDTVCLGAGQGTGTKISTARLTDGKVTSVDVPSGLDVQDLACPSGRPVIVGSPASGSSAKSGAVKVTLTRGDGETAVSVAGGRVDAVAATDSSIVVAAATGGDTELVEIDTTTGKELHRARVKGLTGPLSLTDTSAGWLVYAEDTVTRVNLTTGKSKQFDLPGTLLDS
ncbi:hypothetical protein [Streptomyces caeruleatus]|uniref:Uncharacterized protein n=1 Tax=Streptomyces caeruleatus TaxID=661399 RepID=A0A101TLE5_9ACTN|nr:hypothetical protein [Streptomyces caeruleatus]KUN94491.1 hypothetical protein AQJ67_36760 [Streptomyces caeruleatus]